jgi:hypothetical protein
MRAQTAALVVAAAMAPLVAAQVFTLAGGSTHMASRFTGVKALASDPRRNQVYYAAEDEHLVGCIYPSGEVVRYAGTGVLSNAGIGDTATLAGLRWPTGVAFRPASGELFIADYQRVVRIDPPTGTLQLVAGGAGCTSSTTSVASRRCMYPAQLVADDELLYFTDEGGTSITAVNVTADTAIVTGITGDAIALDTATRTLYVLQGTELRAYRRTGISPAAGGWSNTLIARNGASGVCTGPPLALHDACFETTSRSVYWHAAASTVVVGMGNSGRVVAITMPRGAGAPLTPTGIRMLAGPAAARCDLNIPANTTCLRTSDTAMDGVFSFGELADGTLVVAVEGRSGILRIDGAGFVRYYAGRGSAAFLGDGGLGTSAKFDRPSGLLFAGGDVYITDLGTHTIRRLAIDRTIATIAGINIAGYGGDGGPATLALLNEPNTIALAADGRVLVADSANGVIRRFTVGGMIETIIGRPASTCTSTPSTPDTGPALSVCVRYPDYVAVDRAGNIFYSTNRRIYVSRGGTVSLLAGGGTDMDSNTVAATSAYINVFSGLVIDNDESLLFGDYGNSRDRVRRYDAATQSVTTIAGYMRNSTSVTSSWPFLLYMFARGRDGRLYVTSNRQVRCMQRGRVRCRVAQSGHQGG